MLFTVLEVITISAIMSVVALFLFGKLIHEATAGEIIDILIENGYVKSKKNADGEIELIKLKVGIPLKKLDAKSVFLP